MKKIVVLDGNTLNPGDLTWDRIRQSGDLTVYPRTDYETEKVIEAIGNSEIVFTNKTPLTRDVLEKVPSVRYIGVLATGYNVVDLDAAREKGIVVTNIPDYSTNAVAQFTFALLLEMCHHVGDHNLLVKQGEWTASPDFSFWKYPLIELAGKTIGLIGFGKIGQATAKIAEAFGLKILVNYRHRNPLLEGSVCSYASMDVLLGRIRYYKLTLSSYRGD